MTSLLLIDLSAVFWPAWHASAGKTIDSAYEITIGKVRQLDRGYDAVAICCDSGGRTFRHDIDSNYKANRPERDATAIEQLRRVKETLARDYHLFEAPGFEADDVIATFCSWTSGILGGCEVTIAGADKDLLQLVSDRVRMVKVTNGDVLWPDEVQKKLGVGPELVCDLLALIGDSSDNIKGVKGIGATHGARLLNEFGSLGGIVMALDEKDEDDRKHPWRVKPTAIHDAIVRDMANLELSTKLVKLRTDVPIDCELVFKPGASPPAQEPHGFDVEEEETSPLAPAPAGPDPSSRPGDATPARVGEEAGTSLGNAASPSASSSSIQLPAAGPKETGTFTRDIQRAAEMAEAAIPGPQGDDEMTSTTIADLAAALAKAQGELSHAAKDAENPHFRSRYADLASVWDACRKPLSKHGLSVTQVLRGGEAKYILVTTLMHVSGQWIRSEFPIIADKVSPQGFGSALTYARRYSLAAIVGVSQDDDDAEAGSGRGQWQGNGANRQHQGRV